MDEILLEILDILDKGLKKNQINFIGIMSQDQAVVALFASQIPCVLINAIKESDVNGPFAETITRTYVITFTIWMTFIKLNQGRLEENNIFQVSKKINDLLVQNKKLNGKVDGLNMDYEAFDYDLIDKATDKQLFPDGLGLGRDFTIEVFRYLEWAGPENSQLEGLVRIK